MFRLNHVHNGALVRREPAACTLKTGRSSGWDIAERFTHAALVAHGVGIEPDGFRYTG